MDNGYENEDLHFVCTYKMNNKKYDKMDHWLT